VPLSVIIGRSYICFAALPALAYTFALVHARWVARGNSNHFNNSVWNGFGWWRGMPGSLRTAEWNRDAERAAEVMDRWMTKRKMKHYQNLTHIIG
jgi:hypothetical protein